MKEPASTRGAQLPLGLRFTRDQRLETFHGAPLGLMAALAGLVAAQVEGVFLAGPDGSGRSHLLLGACAEAAETGRSVSYLPLRELGGHAVDALARQAAVQVACVDDVHAVAGQPACELALFDFHNRVRDAGGTLLYAADAAPIHLPLALPDLRSRLAQCAQFTLSASGEAARRQIVRERGLARGLELDEPVLDYLFRRSRRDLVSLTALLDRLDRESLAAQRRITVPFLRQVLGEGQD